MTVAKGTNQYLDKLSAFLGEDAPKTLAFLGNADLLAAKRLAVFCSVTCPASLILAAHDLAKALRASSAGHVVVSGFHSPVEKEVLTVLLGGTQPVAKVAARGLEGMRVKRAYKGALKEGRLLFVSPFSAKHKRATAQGALYRNHVVAALADAVLFVHASAEGKTEALAKEVVAWGKPCFVLRSRHNAHLVGAGLIEVGADEVSRALEETI